MFCSEVKVTAAIQTICCIGRGDRGGEQNWRPKHNEITAAPRKNIRAEVAVRECCGKADLVRAGGRPMFLWEETGKSTIEAHRGKGIGIQGKTNRDNVGKGHLPAGAYSNLQRLMVQV